MGTIRRSNRLVARLGGCWGSRRKPKAPDVNLGGPFQANNTPRQRTRVSCRRVGLAKPMPITDRILKLSSIFPLTRLLSGRQSRYCIKST